MATSETAPTRTLSAAQVGQVQALLSEEVAANPVSRNFRFLYKLQQWMVAVFGICFVGVATPAFFFNLDELPGWAQAVLTVALLGAVLAPIAALTLFAVNFVLMRPFRRRWRLLRRFSLVPSLSAIRRLPRLGAGGLGCWSSAFFLLGLLLLAGGIVAGVVALTELRSNRLAATTIGFFAAASLTLGLIPVGNHLFRRAFRRYRLVENARELSQHLTNEQSDLGDASARGSVEISWEAERALARIESLHLRSKRSLTIRSGRDSELPESYSVLKSQRLVAQQLDLPPTRILELERALQQLGSEPRPSGARALADDRLEVWNDELDAAIVYQVDEAGRQVRALGLEPSGDGEEAGDG